jgi:hypothetical protein
MPVARKVFMQLYIVWVVDMKERKGMNIIILKSDILIVTKINKKTKAKMFENLKVGDKVEFSVPIKHAGSNHGTYATYIGIRNVETGEETSSSFNQLPTVLRAFEFEKED